MIGRRGYSQLYRVAAWSLLAALGLAAGGCAALRGSGTEGLEMDGPFRGRWWSYYDRGRAWQKQGNFEEAERDLRIALQSRGKDSLWPRTYGMHFIPEYFPHRELGINLYYQDQNENAIELLETSLGQQYSARAAYYFKEAQMKRLQSGAADSAPPTVEILSDTAGLNVTTFEFSGLARDDSFVSAIEIDGAPVDVRVIDAEVPFSKSIALAPGQNSVHIRVTDLAGNVVEQDVSLQNDVDGPAVSFDPLLAGSGILSGKVFDPSGVTSLTVGGVKARLVEESPGLASFDIAAPIGAPLDFSSADELGNVTRGQVPFGAPEIGAPAESVALASSSPAHAVEFMLTKEVRVAASVVSAEPIRIDLENIPEGAEYYQDDIVVALNAHSTEPIQSVSLLGTTIPVIPARNDVYVTRRVRLDPGGNILDAAITDTKGNQAEVERNIRREENELEVRSNKLGVALLPKSTESDPLTEDMIKGLYDLRSQTIPDSKGEAEAFDHRFELVEREKLALLLGEQTLSAELSSSERAIEIGKLIPYEVLLVVQARLDNSILEIVVDGISSEKGVPVTGRVDVAGDKKDTDELLRQLAIRLLQEFPQPQGEVIYWNSPEIDVTLTEAQGTRRHRKCLVFRLDEQLKNGVPIGVRPTVVAEGFITGVGDEYSSAELFKATGDGDLKSLALGEGHYVVLK